jgi:hypothetical protein
LNKKFIRACWVLCGAALCAWLVLAVTVPAPIVAQSRTRSRTQRRPTPKPTPTPTPAPLNLSAEAAQVAEQIKLISRFLYVYGKVTNGLELAEEQNRRGELTSTAAAQNQKSKETVVGNISGLRAGVANLLTRFQHNARLQVYYLKVSNAVDAVANAERLAGSNRFDEAGKSLVLAVERLTDVMLALR